MDYEIIKRLWITPDKRVMIRHASGGERPRTLRENEAPWLTDLLRTVSVLISSFVRSSQRMIPIGRSMR